MGTTNPFNGGFIAGLGEDNEFPIPSAIADK